MEKSLYRLLHEYDLIQKTDLLDTINGKAEPINKDFFNWKASFSGPKAIPYERGLYFIQNKIPFEYPNSPPQVQMRTPIYHVNIRPSDDHICSEYLNKWKPENSILEIIYIVWGILAEENPHSAYYPPDRRKAYNFNEEYAGPSQEYDWNSSWNKGWENLIKKNY